MLFSKKIRSIIKEKTEDPFRLLYFVIFLFLIACTSSTSERRLIELRMEVDDLKSRIEELELYNPTKNGLVSLSRTSHFQPIDPFLFDVSIMDTKEHLTGIKIKGEMLNKSSVGCMQCKFSVLISDQEQEFTVNTLRSGRVSNFEVYVPNVPKEKVAFAVFRFVGGTTQYYLH